MGNQSEGAGTVVALSGPMVAILVVAVLVGTTLVWHLAMLGVDARRRRREEADRWAGWRGLP